MFQQFFKRIGILFSSKLKNGEHKSIQEMELKQEVLKAKLEALDEIEAKLKEAVK